MWLLNRIRLRQEQARARRREDPLKDEHRRALKADLYALWLWVFTQLSDEDKRKSDASITEIDALFKQGGDDFAWIQCNKVELLMLPLLPESVLDAHFRHALDEARQNGMAQSEHYKEMERRFLKEDPSEKATPKPTRDAKQEAYRTLLSELHQYYLNRRFRRDLRLRTAWALLVLAGGILILAAIPVALFALSPESAGGATSDRWTRAELIRDPMFCFFAAAAFGILGAFFSRLMSFQSRQQTYGFEELLHNFDKKFVAVRCAVGMFGAIVFFLLMRSGLLGGTLFPQEAELNDAGKLVLPFAKLLVWSFIAGWSERLVPDALERTAAKPSEPEKPAGK